MRIKLTRAIRNPPWFKVWSAITSVALTIALVLTFLPVQVSVDTGGLLSISLNPAKANPSFTARTETYADYSWGGSPGDGTVNKPTGTAEGDILFTWIGTNNGALSSSPSGWIVLGSYTASGDKYYLYYKIAGGSEPSSYTWSFAATYRVRLVCSCYTSGDFDPGDPIDVVSNTAYRTYDTNCQAASMTVAAANSPLVFWGGWYGAIRDFTKPTVPTTDWVEDDDAGSTTSQYYTEICSMIWSGSGATGTMIATISASGSTKHAFAVALNPAAAEPEITNAPDNYGFGILQIGTTVATSIDYFTLNNTGNCTVDVTIQGTNLTGGDDTWTLSDTATPGNNIYGLYAGLDTTDDTFATLYPDAHPEATSVDGFTERYGAQTWASLRDGAGVYFADSITTAEVVDIRSTTNPDWYVNTRGIFLFDTSSLPDDAVITSATLSLYGASKQDTFSPAIAPNINIYASTPASNTALQNSDYQQLGLIPLCDTPITYAGWSISGYNNFSLNTAGLAAITTTGVSKLGTRNANYDVANVTPTYTASAEASLYCHTSEVGEGYKPKLVVYYTYTIAEFNVVVNTTANALVSDLAEDATQAWGLKIYMPTSLSGYDAQQMSGTVTLVASAA